MHPPLSVFFSNAAATTATHTLSLHDALPISGPGPGRAARGADRLRAVSGEGRLLPADRSEEHTSELQSHVNLVCRLLLEKKKRTGKVSVRRGSALTVVLNCRVAAKERMFGDG